ncbi:unnamed protein product [Rotaria sp. Silwood2]|nr:unnamed protein product [Rotaria sp. Silwood2]CAF2983700.1 unnamed protein product [Rotaria sp. Silwood2]CAF3350265.1 unnamed protein product [Rotaria sp. Silwood2]CAF3979247.1 unnamed protein product [Rotaria sp. Silwood2]CAF4105699.1 unnamed protein product [Rotaria sp. Silwood2]
MAQRTANWHHLSTNVLPKLGLHVPNMIMVDITNGARRAVELFLLQLRKTLQEYTIRIQQTLYEQGETGRSYNVGHHRLPQVPTTARQTASLPAITGAIPPGSTGTNLSVITGANSSGITGANRNIDSLAPCREALRLKDEELGELRKKVKTYEKLLREKVKTYEKLLRTKDNRIQELEMRLGKAKIK